LKVDLEPLALIGTFGRAFGNGDFLPLADLINDRRHVCFWGVNRTQRRLVTTSGFDPSAT